MVSNKNGKVNQQWKVVYADEYQREPIKGELNKKFGLYVERDFYVVSAMTDHRYLDLISNKNMVIKTPNGRKTQIWYFHQASLTIRTRYNNQSWDIKNSGTAKDMQLYSTNSKWFQVFKYENKQFINFNKGMVLNVWKSKDEEGQAVTVDRNHGVVAQQWDVVYLDKADKQ
jgi:hypothetical protein